MTETTENTEADLGTEAERQAVEQEQQDNKLLNTQQQLMN